MAKKTTGRIVVVMEQLCIVTHHAQVIQVHRTKHTHTHTRKMGHVINSVDIAMAIHQL